MGQIGLAESDRTGQRPPDPAGAPFDQRTDAVGQLGGASRAHCGHQLGVGLPDHCRQELPYVGADPTTAWVEWERVVDDPR